MDASLPPYGRVYLAHLGFWEWLLPLVQVRAVAQSPHKGCLMGASCLLDPFYLLDFNDLPLMSFQKLAHPHPALSHPRLRQYPRGAQFTPRSWLVLNDVPLQVPARGCLRLPLHQIKSQRNSIQPGRNQISNIIMSAPFDELLFSLKCIISLPTYLIYTNVIVIPCLFD